MKAIIMAGGQGTRVRSLTSDQPKPMIRIANLPRMEHIVKRTCYRQSFGLPIFLTPAAS